MLQTIQNWINGVAAPAIRWREIVNNSDNDIDYKNVISSLDENSSLIRQKTGKALFDSFREQIEDFIALEYKLLEVRQTIVLEAEKVSDLTLIAMSENEKSVAYTIEIIKRANALLTAALDMETGMRGYLLAGKSEFLEPYIKGIKDFDDETNKLLGLISKDMSQTNLLKDASKTIKTWEIEAVNPTLTLPAILIMALTQ